MMVDTTARKRMIEAGRAAPRQYLRDLADQGIRPPKPKRLRELARKLRAGGVDSLSDIVTEEREFRRKRASE